MPTINRPQRKKRCLKSGKNKEINRIYASKQWVNLRNAYYMQHPLCEKCLENGVVSPTEEIHHIKPISTGKDLLEMKEIAYNPYNLMALCKDCHHKIHNRNVKRTK